MQIADILSPHVAPGAVVFDMTSDDSDLSSHAVMAPQFGVRYQRGLVWNGEPPPVGLVLQHLHDVDSTGREITLDVGEVAARIVHVVFFDRPEIVTERGLLEQVAAAGWKLTGVYATGHGAFRYAAVLVPDADASHAQLRVHNEYRFDRFLLRDQDATLARLTRRVADLEAALTARDAQLAEARAQRATFAERAASAERELKTARRRLARARGSFSFRLGRATRLALRDAPRDPLGTPARWLATFRGRDEMLDDEP